MNWHNQIGNGPHIIKYKHNKTTDEHHIMANGHRIMKFEHHILRSVHQNTIYSPHIKVLLMLRQLWRSIIIIFASNIIMISN